jgi:hypothetical protein
MDFEYGCEECGTENEDLFDTILDNKSMRLCEKCARVGGALVLREERSKSVEKWNSRGTKKPEQVYKEQPPVTLQGLWDRYKQRMGERNTLENRRKVEILEEKKFLEDLERQKKLENKEIAEAVDSEFNPEEKIEQEKSFNLEASNKIDVKGFFKTAFKFLKGKEKTSSEVSDDSQIPDMVPDMIESFEEKKDEN